MPDFICLTVTKLDVDIEECYNIPNYSLVCNSPNRNGCGVCIYAHDGQAHYVCSQLNMMNSDIEYLLLCRPGKLKDKIIDVI